ncbi:MAG: hypothetical protein ACRBC3_11315 [Burkholderiaceae bacterium]
MTPDQNKQYGSRSRDSLRRWLDLIVVDAFRQFHWSYVPPLMVYLAAGVSGLTAVVGTFFIKEYLGLSAGYLAGLGFWAGLPWTLKMPLGHLVDLWWHRKAWLVYLGATLIAASLAIMYGLVMHADAMRALMSVETWFVLSTLLAPTGYVVQDVVADAMTVEAVPVNDPAGVPFPEDVVKRKHTTMQTFGRFAIIGGSMLVAALNISLFSGVADMSEADRIAVYGRIYLISLVIPCISVAGVLMAAVLNSRRKQPVALPAEPARPNWWILGGSLVFVLFTVLVGASDLPAAQEIVFVGAFGIILFLMNRLLRELNPQARRGLIGTAVIVFVFRALPMPGAGATWFEIDALGFDQQFLAVLSLISTMIAMVGMVVLRPLMASRSIAYVVALLTIAAGVLALPNIGLFYGVHNWTAAWTGGVVDARAIALVDTMLESPLGQIAMIPMLAWIARIAPDHLKATFFAVMASFTNLALSASSLGTKYLNRWLLVTREVRDKTSQAVVVPADYSDLGVLLITVALIGLVVPLLIISIVQNSRWRTEA